MKKSEIEIDHALGNLASGAAQEDSVDSFMDPVKKGRGRPKGTKNRPKDGTPAPGASPLGAGNPENDPRLQLEQTKKYIRPVVEIASKAGVKLCESEEGAMSPSEIEIIAESAAACVQQYLPNALGDHANLIVLLTVTGNWAAKVYMIRLAKIEEYRRRAAAAKHVNPDPSPEMPVN